MAWFDALLPASFNGVPFYVENLDKNFGRRKVDNEYPLRDDPYIEDLGRLPRRFKLKAYFAGDFFAAERALLEAALERSSTAGTLILPTYGILRVWVGECASSETRAGGSYATIDMEFTQDGGASSPLSITDTASALLDGLNDLVPFLVAAYVARVAISLAASVVQSLIGQQLVTANTQFGMLPQSTIGALTFDFAAAPGDAVATASAVTTAFAAAAANVVAAQPVAQPANAVSGSVPLQPLPADPSGGLAAMASFGSALTQPPAAALPALGIAQTALLALIQGAALMGVVTIYAQLDWQSAQAAAAAREALQDLLDAQVAAAADAGNFDLFRAWRAISQQAIGDMVSRAQNLPNLVSYQVGASIPALTLAQLLYQDGSQADGLVALNDVAHPLFMPARGNWLQAA
jgi:prophage DNA circulation protein